MTSFRATGPACCSSGDQIAWGDQIARDDLSDSRRSGAGVGDRERPVYRHRFQRASDVGQGARRNGCAVDGGYHITDLDVEAGDTGRHCVTEGDVIVHRDYESHLNRFGPHGAEVLVLPFAGNWNEPIFGQFDNPDYIVRLAERCPKRAVSALRSRLKARQPTFADWPDILAADLIADPELCIAQWAQRYQMHPGSVSRGFRQQFGVTPAGFRSAARAQRAVRTVAGSQTPLAEIALTAGFADQAHMGNAVRRLTGLSPTALRRRSRQLSDRLPTCDVD